MFGSLTTSELVPDGFSTVSFIVGGLVAATFTIVRLSQGPNLEAIPTVGSSSWLGSWWYGLKYFFNAEKMIREGYEKHKSAPFKIPTLFRWVVLLSSRQHIEELRNAPDDAFSFMEVPNDEFNMAHIVGHDVQYNAIHVPVIRTQLTRNLGILFPEILDEVVTSLDELLDLQGTEWKSIPGLNIVQKVVCRVSNRVFVGLPLCRNSDFVDLNVNWTVTAITGGLTIGLFPTFLKSLAVRFLTNVPRTIKRNLDYLRPIIEERQRCLETYGKEWADKPNDYLSWMMDVAKGPERQPESLNRFLLATNIASIHTTSTMFTGALFTLAANPQYIQLLREEVETIVQEEGWSKMSVNKMHKVDSFLKECIRQDGIDMLGVSRKSMKDYTFSDGLFIPKGVKVAVASRALHHDEAFYPNAAAFDPLRFSNMREDEEDGKNQFTTTSPEYLSFGYGKHACPGRFFAANELKILLAHIVVCYDVKLEGDTAWRICIGNLISINPKAKLVFRKRVD